MAPIKDHSTDLEQILKKTFISKINSQVNLDQYRLFKEIERHLDMDINKIMHSITNIRDNQIYKLTTLTQLSINNSVTRITTLLPHHVPLVQLATT